MILIAQYDYIRMGHRVYGKSIWELQRETGHSRNTIRKVLKEELKPYPKRKEQPYPVLGPYIAIIEDWLLGDQDNPVKQRHTAKRIFDRLVAEHDFAGAESSIRHFVRDAKLRLGVGQAAVFIPLEPDCGEAAEVDWGTATVKIKGEAQRVHFFCMRSKYSGKHWVRCYPCERQQAFFDGHLQAFAYFGGVFRVLIYDNLTTAVRRVLVGKGRVEQSSFMEFKAYYNFTSRFCNPGSGHEKGGVEGMVGYVRRNYLVPIPEVESLEELNEQLLQRCVIYGEHRLSGREARVNELFAAEQGRLLSLPTAEFGNVQIREGKVDKYSTVTVDHNRYSVPTFYAGVRLGVELYVDRVELFHQGKSICVHLRSYGNNKWLLNPDHYLDLLEQRPGAFNEARPIREWRRQWPESQKRLLEKFILSQGESKGIKDFIKILKFYREHRVEAIEAAIEQALAGGVSGSAGVEHLLLYSKRGSKPEPLAQWPPTLPADISVYGQLGGER